MSRPILRYKFLLNGVELNNVVIGASVIDKFEEPLDEGGIHLPFTIRDYEYEMRGLLNIVATDGTNEKSFDLLIISDKVTAGSKYGEWKHDLSVLEYTHKLDVYMVHSLAKTKATKDETPAPFTVELNTLDLFEVFASVEPIELLNTYYDDETVFIPQVDEAYVLTNTTTGEYVRRPAWLRINGVSVHNLTNGSFSDTLDVGLNEIEYGFWSETATTFFPSGFNPIYTFYVRVILKDEITIYDLVQLVRKNISKYGGIESKLYFDDTRLFDIDTAIEEYLKTVEAPQTYIQKATARQVLNSIFLYINSISRLKYVEDDVDLLGIDEFNKIVGSFNIEDVSNYGSTQNAKHLGNKGISWLERALPNNLEEATIKSPSENQFRTVRSNDIQIRQDNFTLPLERAIYRPMKFSVMVKNLKIVSENIYSTDEYVYGSDFEIDLTARLINREEWLLKLINVNFPTTTLLNAFSDNVGLRPNRVGNLYWQKGRSEIVLSNVFGEVFEDNLIINVIKEAINEYVTRNFVPIINSSNQLVWDYSVSFDTLEFRDLRFNIEYISLEDLTIQSNREDLSYSPYYSESRINQTDKLLNVALASRKSYGDLQRAGVPNITFEKYHEDLGTIFDVGLQDSNGYVIIERKLTFYNEHIHATYVATKDHNRLSEFIGLAQAYRVFEIPQSNQVFERNETYGDYIIITKPSETLDDNATTKLYSNNAFNLIFGTLANWWNGSTTLGKTKITLAYVRTDGFLEIFEDGTYKHAIMTPVASFGVKGGFVFTFGFENNQVAFDRIEISTASIGGATLYWNDPVRYTNLQGKMNELWFSLVTKFTENSGWTQDELNANYPLIRTSGTNFGSLNDTYYRCGLPSPTATGHDPLIIEKDSGQSLKISYQNSVISKDYLHYIFGQLFYSENFIVKNPKVVYNQVVGTPMYIYIYENNTKYGKFDDLKVKTGYVSTTLLEIALNVVISASGRTFRFGGNVNLTNATSWAIGDENLNLYMACNGNENGFNFYKFHFRPDQQEIGNK